MVFLIFGINHNANNTASASKLTCRGSISYPASVGHKLDSDRQILSFCFSLHPLPAGSAGTSRPRIIGTARAHSSKLSICIICYYPALPTIMCKTSTFFLSCSRARRLLLAVLVMLPSPAAASLDICLTLVLSKTPRVQCLGWPKTYFTSH